MTEKWYDENGYDDEGYDKDGVNVYGEVSPAKAGMNQEKEDILSSCKTEAGRRFLWRIISFCKIYDDFEPLQNDKEDQRQIGRRTVGMYIMGILEEADPEIILNMMNENYRKQKELDYARRTYKR